MTQPINEQPAPTIEPVEMPAPVVAINNDTPITTDGDKEAVDAEIVTP